MKLRKTKKGFTIVELVIVIGVIGILTGILIPTFVNVTQKAEEAALKSNLANAFSAYVVDATDDGKVDNAQHIYERGTTTEAAAGTYYIDNIKQEDVVLVGSETNKDKGQAYQFVDGEWKKVDVTIAKDGDIAKRIVYNDSSLVKLQTESETKKYFDVIYGTYYVFNSKERTNN